MFALLGFVSVFCAQAADAEEFVFVPDLDQVVEMNHGSTISYGTLNRRGEFIAKYEWANVDPAQITSVPFRSRRLNPARKFGRPEKIYEFRSERLIPGELDEEGHFIPELGGEIIAFKDYKYVPNKSRRIYNLPGRFVKRSEVKKEELKKKEGK